MKIPVLHLLLSLVLTEIGANPPGPESGSGSPGDRFEFVELWNETPETLDLAGVFLDDGDEADSLVAWTDPHLLDRFPDVHIGTLLLPPYAYAVILDPEATDSLEGFPWPLAPSTVVIRPQDTDLGNGLATTDPVGLRTTQGWLSTYGITASWADTTLLNPPDGVSVERRDPWGPDTPSNFRESRWHATPGRRNSWSLNQNLALTGLQWRPRFPAPAAPIQVLVNLENLGLSDHQSLLHLEVGDKTLRHYVALASDSATQETLHLEGLDTGTWLLHVALEPDEDPSNDSLQAPMVVDLGPVVINEIQYQDTVEWVELHNPTDTTLSLEGWHLQDASGQTSGPLTGTLPPNGYRVLAQSPSFAALWPGVPHQVLSPWPTLNNQGDTLYLCDPRGHVWDAVPFEASWGGGPAQSLERVSPQRPARYPWNWQPCDPNLRGTPGRRNSAYLEATPSSPIALVQSVVSPGETVTLTYRLSATPGSVEAWLFDGTGRRLGRVASVQTSGATGTLHWTAPQTPGLYLVLVRMRWAGSQQVHKTTFVVTP